MSDTATALAELVKARKGFFFEKKKQKTFLNWAIGHETGTDQINDVFFASFLFTKKKTLPCSAGTPTAAARYNGHCSRSLVFPVAMRHAINPTRRPSPRDKGNACRSKSP
jgi:hypothetical protein